MIGKNLLHYEILDNLGAGGMGDVYRAEDTRLGREVALKTVREEFTGDRERIARFEREARLLASLNHPNIAAIYGLEKVEGKYFLVLELVEGETLATRLGRGPLPLNDALEMARQIATAIEAAHEKGIVHRDLKPANLMIPDGRIKILDFGVAKVWRALTPRSDLTEGSTVTAELTRPGGILGTPAYMSPEQVRGQPVDTRSDIWSFGCVLYEMLTGRPAFQRGTVSDTLAAVLNSSPDWSALPADTPSGVRRVLRRCLEKDTGKRLHAIADARIELEDPDDAAVPEALPGVPGRRTKNRWIGGAGLATGLLAGVILAYLLIQGAPPRGLPLPALRASIVLPDDASVHLGGWAHSLSLSHDGRRLAYVSRQGNTTVLSLRNLNDGKQWPLPGTEGARAPFFSPDGEWLGFFANNKLQKVPVTGGDPTVLAEVPPLVSGASWGEDGWIVVAPSYNESLVRVSVDKRTVDEFMGLHPEQGEKGHLWPQVLLGGKAVLFTVRTGSDPLDVEDSAIAIEYLDTGERREVVRSAHFARYVETGHLVFLRGRTLMIAPFEVERAEIIGKAVPIADDVHLNSGDRVPQFTVSAQGLLVYAGADLQESQVTTSVVQLHENGEREVLPLPGGRFYSTPRLAPGGERLALVVGQGNDINIWGYDLDRGVMAIMTHEQGREFAPVWSSDGSRLAYCNFSEGLPQMFWVPADGSGPAEELRISSTADFPSSWSPDGSTLAFTVIETAVQSLGHNVNIWTMQVGEPESARPWLDTPFNEADAIFSPDGRWIAYVSDESGTRDVYIRPFAGPGGKTKVSASGGWGPAWSVDQRTLYYREQRGLMAVPIESDNEIQAGTGRLVLEGDFASVGSPPRRNYDLSTEPHRYIMVEHTVSPTLNTRLQVVTGLGGHLAN